MLRLVHAVAVLSLLLSPAGAGAKTFVFDHLLEVSSAGASSGGTPRGLAVAGADLLVSDALDDQIFRFDPSDPASLLATYETDPFTCAASAVPLDCAPTQDWARVVRDIAWDGTSIWAVDKETIDGSSTWLIELDPSGQMLRRIDISTSGSNPGGLTHDARTGGLIVTDNSSGFATHLDANGASTGISALAGVIPTGIAHFGDGLFFVSDLGTDTVLEYEIGAGGGPATFIAETIFQGFDLSVINDLQSVDYDAATQTLYLLDGTSSTNSVYVFTLVPEPGTGLLLAAGLVGLAARRRRA